MVSRIHSWHEIGVFLLTAGIILFLLLLVVVPAQSQRQPPAPSQTIELVEDQAQPNSSALMAFLILQLLFLTGMTISYMIFSARITAHANFSRHHHWWHRLHWRR
jgi:predicted MFS family arabinose efflux permease